MADMIPTQILDEDTVSLLRCPVTGSPLKLEAGYLIGQAGGLRYPVKDGIPVLLAEEAALPPGIESLEAFRKKFASR
jgi:uncharacterized protein